MKRLIAAVIIATLLFAISLMGNITINSTTREVEKKIESIQKHSFDDTEKRAEEFFYFWDKKREIMAIFVNHEKIDEIGNLAARMVSAERSENFTDLFESANEILFIIRGIAEDEQFGLYTLL